MFGRRKISIQGVESAERIRRLCKKRERKPVHEREHDMAHFMCVSENKKLGRLNIIVVCYPNV